MVIHRGAKGVVVHRARRAGVRIWRTGVQRGAMPTPLTPLPRHLRASTFTYAAARGAGVSARRLRHVGLRAPAWGLRTARAAPAAGPERLVERCHDLLSVLPDGSVFCDETALGLLGIDLPRGVHADGDLQVVLPPGSSRPRRRGVHGRLRPIDTARDLRWRHGLPVLDPIAVWVQLAGRLTVVELVVLGDALTRRKRPWCTPAALEARVAALPAGTRGVRRLREAVTLVRARTDSCMESRLRYLLIDGGLPCPLVNHEVQDDDGWFVAMPDLAYPALKIAIEYDGDVHRTDRRTWRRDIARRQALEALGWRVITCTADDVDRTPDRTLSLVRAAIRSRR